VLEQLTGAAFAPYVGQPFAVLPAGLDQIDLELVSVTESTPGRRPFALLFRGPASDIYLRQQTHRLEHPQLGALELFLVPIGPEDGCMRYEAIFN
jgi:hypothetical protein